jgi:Protein of unknown function (DUF3800)
MYLFYGDESGHTGGKASPTQPVLVVAGLMVNTWRHGTTTREFRDLMERLSGVAGVELTELKGRELFKGSGQWRDVPHERRAEARHAVLQWIGDRKHRVVAVGIIYDRWPSAESLPELGKIRPRAFASTWCGLAIQRAQFASGIGKQNKQVCVMVLDRQDGQDETTIQNALTAPPSWALDFVNDRQLDGQLSAIVDTAYFGDSAKAPLIQVADFLAFMIQRKCSLECGSKSGFDGEKDIIDDVFEALSPLLLPRKHRLPAGKEPIKQALKAFSPDCLYT